MKINVEIDCTPKEARTFLGLPDVEPLHETMLGALKEKMQESMKLMEPEAFLKQWMPLGLQSLDQMQKFFWSAAKGMGGEPPKG